MYKLALINNSINLAKIFSTLKRKLNVDFEVHVIKMPDNYKPNGQEARPNAQSKIHSPQLVNKSQLPNFSLEVIYE